MFTDGEAPALDVTFKPLTTAPPRNLKRDEGVGLKSEDLRSRPLEQESRILLSACFNTLGAMRGCCGGVAIYRNYSA